MVRLVWVVAALAVLLAGCAGGKANPRWFGNRGALESTLWRPAMGSPDERAYFAPDFKGGELGVVEVRTPSVTGSGGERLERFHARVGANIASGAAAAVAGSERSKGFAVAGGPAPDTVLSSEAFVHVANVDASIVNDPILNDPRSKVFVIYTLTSRATGEVLLRYTTVLLSDWEYGPAVMEDLERAGLRGGSELLYLLKNF